MVFTETVTEMDTKTNTSSDTATHTWRWKQGMRMFVSQQKQYNNTFAACSVTWHDDNNRLHRLQRQTLTSSLRLPWWRDAAARFHCDTSLSHPLLIHRCWCIYTRWPQKSAKPKQQQFVRWWREGSRTSGKSLNTPLKYIMSQWSRKCVQQLKKRKKSCFVGLWNKKT